MNLLNVRMSQTFLCLTQYFIFRRMEGMDAVSSTQSHWSWLQPENWPCRSMTRQERWVSNLNRDLIFRVIGRYKCASMFFSFCVPVCVSLSRTSLRSVWWGRHRSTDQGVGERLSPARSYTWTSGWHDGKRQNRSGLLQVSITQEFTSVLSYFYWFKTSTVAL